jgi:hypothetical protein
MQQMCQKAAGSVGWMKLARRRYPGPALRAADGNAAAILCHGPSNLGLIENMPLPKDFGTGKGVRVWLNMVERFFAEITRKRIRRGTFKSVAELKSAIMEHLESHNADPKPFIWTKSAGQILEKVARAKQALESQH